MPWFGDWLGGGGSGSAVVGGPFSAGDIIRQARTRHPAFSDRAIPVPVALSLISTVQADLHQAAQQRDTFYVVGTYMHLLTTFNPAVPLPAHAGVSGGRVLLTTDADGTGELYVTSRPARMHAPRHWVAVLINQQLTLVGDADYWSNVREVDVYYAPVATALASEADALLLPASAWSAVIAALAAQMGARCAALGISGVDVAGLTNQANTAISVWLDTVGRRGKAIPLRLTGGVR